MKRLAVIALFIGFSAAAEAARFSKPGGSPERFEVDKAHCIYEARMATLNISSSTATPKNAGKDAGVAEESLSQAEERRALACMASKGYIQEW